MAVDGTADPNFTVVMRGYEREEVDAYLRDLVAETTRLGQRVAELESELESARDRGAAGSSPEDGFRQLGEETTRILVAAETAAREMREKAERQADAELDAAEKAARERVENASAHADRIVAEAESRQRDVEAEIRQLEDVRAEMVDRLRGAISTTEQAITNVPSVDVDAPAAPADTAARRTEPVATSPFEAVEDPVEVESAPGDVGEDVAGTDTAAADLDTEAAGAELDEPAVVEQITERDPIEPETTKPAPVEPAPAPVEPAPAEPEAAELDQDEPHHGADRGALEAALAEADAAAGRAPTAAPEAEQADVGMLRERSLAGVRPGMLRRLRRSLQELQNGVLESVRTRDEDTPVEALLPTTAEATGLADVARIFLDAGYRAGRADAPVLLGDEALQDPPTDGTVVGDTAEGLAEALLDELRTTLAPSLRAGVEADEPGASLSERVGEVFRDLKGPVIETVVDRHLTRTYGRATLDGLAEEGVSEVRWVLGEETRCPEGMCRANEDEGAVELGSDFPSGHAVPLAHDGCTCALEPA